MKVKIKDIAAKAGVSLATVSLALNDKPGVSRRTREKIWKIARDMHYQRIYFQDLGRMKRGTLRFLKIAKHGRTINRDHDVFIADYIEGLDRESRRLGFKLEVTSFNTQDIRTVADSMLNSEADGFIILGTELNYADVARFEKLEKPMVIIDTYFDFLNCTFVDMNNVDSVFRIVSHFTQNGHTSIGFITSLSDVNNFRHRESGFRDAMHHFGLSYRDEFVYSVDSTFDGACRDMLAILESDPPLPTALFACNDVIAYGCIKALKEKGLSVPDDISIIGFDDLPMSSVMEPPLTTIQVSKERIGATAVQLISMMLDNGPGMPPSKITISGELIIRDSVRKLDAAEPVPELLTPQG